MRFGLLQALSEVQRVHEDQNLEDKTRWCFWLSKHCRALVHKNVAINLSLHLIIANLNVLKTFKEILSSLYIGIGIV